MSAVLLLAKEVIKPTDPEFKKTPSKIQNDARYMPLFKVINFFLSLFSTNDSINYYFLILYYNDDRIILEQWMELMYVHIFLQKTKYGLLEGKGYLLKM